MLEEGPVEDGPEDATCWVLTARVQPSLYSVAGPSVPGFPLSWPWAESHCQ